MVHAAYGTSISALLYILIMPARHGSGIEKKFRPNDRNEMERGVVVHESRGSFDLVPGTAVSLDKPHTRYAEAPPPAPTLH